MYFEIDGYRKKALLEGIDEIGNTLQFESQITDYEKKNISNFVAPRDDQMPTIW
jgi:3-isopropylmalate dehydratase small subunit